MFDTFKKKRIEKQKQRHAEALTRVKSAMDAGDAREVVRLYRKIVKVDPEFAEAWANLGTALAMDGKFAKAEECLRKSVALEDDSHNTWFNLSLSVYEQGRVEEALDLMDRAIALNPPKPLSHLVQRGGMLMDLKRLDEASVCLQEALTHDDSEAGVWHLLVTCQQQNQAWDAARITLDAGLKKHGWNAGIRQLNARQLSHEGFSAEACEEFAQVLRLDPDNPTAWLERSLELFNTEDPDMAEEALPSMERALEMEGDNPHAHLLYGLMLVRSGKVLEGVAVLDKVMADQKDLEGDVWPTLARFHLSLYRSFDGTDAKAAQHHLRKALAARKKMEDAIWFEVLEDEIAEAVFADDTSQAEKLVDITAHGKDRFSPACALLRFQTHPDDPGFDKLTLAQQAAVTEMLIRYAPVDADDLDLDDLDAEL